MLIFHILIALTSLIFAGYTSIYPTMFKIRIMYAFTLLTTTTGISLTYTTPSHMVPSCIEGLLYLFLVISAIVYAKYKIGITKEQ